MGKIASYLVSFVLGAATVIALGFYSLHDLRFALSPALQFANGSSYKGELKDGLLHGRGHLVWANGDEYEGRFSKGLFQGTGKLVTQNYSIYEGEFYQGYMQGQGTLSFENGTKYIGTFSKNAFNGRGKLISADKSVYYGDFKNNEITGKGKWIFSDKAIYRGELKNGVFNGKGKLTRPDGSRYSGDFVDGKMHGLGVYKANKNSYSGEFVEGQFTGKGVHKDDAGNITKGTFVAWVANGKATKIDGDGNEWTGDFKNGELSGQGSYVGKDGETYTGEFDYGQYFGKGKLHEKNGDEYEGEFKYGSKSGAGALVYKEPIDGIKKITGVWKNDRLIESDEVKIYSAENVSDYAIYHQQTELNKKLDSVHVSDPNKTELYSLVIAAYGTQEVFRRESKFIESKLVEQYQNTATSIYLTNSQRSLDENPLATLRGIKDSILQLSKKMDKENDIFFLYITSHGSKDKKISLSHKGLELGDIDSKWLGEILKNSGIKHKVIVLSACYSGGFIDDLKDDASIIITSASADRTSFGCADDNQFTYFGRAYFKESLTPKTDFVSAFYKAKDLVDKWEKAEKEKPSNPQIYSAPEVETYVKAWNANANNVGAPK